VRFFFDACLSVNLAEAMAGLRRPGEHYEVVHLSSRWPSGCDDAEWISALGREGGWIIVSGDERIARKGPERLAWKESRLPAFFLVDEFVNDRAHMQLSNLARWWPEIVAAAAIATPGQGYVLQAKSNRPKLRYS
jgi:hypothetical protein